MARKSRKTAASDLMAQGTANPAQEMKTYRTAAYARLSVEDSKNPDCDTIENQLSLVRSYIEEKPYLTQTAEYIDNGVSGTRFDRPEFMRMGYGYAGREDRLYRSQGFVKAWQKLP